MPEKLSVFFSVCPSFRLDLKNTYPSYDLRKFGAIGLSVNVHSSTFYASFVRRHITLGDTLICRFLWRLRVRRSQMFAFDVVVFATAAICFTLWLISAFERLYFKNRGLQKPLCLAVYRSETR